MKNGYVLVDCTGFDLGNPVKVDGIYDKMMKAYNTGKLVICENMKNGTVKFTPIAGFIALEVDGTTTTIILTIMNLPYRISANDIISQS